MKNFKHIHKLYLNKIIKLGSTVDDSSHKRTIRQLVMDKIEIPAEIIDELSQYQLLDKFEEDWLRMTESMKYVSELALRDENSRQLMLFNTRDFFNHLQCFQLMQFIHTGFHRYTAIVYQRSADMAKFKDDCIFFSKLIKKFDESTYKCTNKLIIVYGSLHA